MMALPFKATDMRSRPFLGCLAAATGVVMALCLPAHAASGDPAAFVTAFEAQSRQMAGDAGLSPADRQLRFHALVDKTFDFPLIARYVLGRYWQTTADDVRQEFTRTFEDFIIEGYGAHLNDYSGEIPASTSERAEGERATIVVNKFAHDGGDEPTTIEWRVQTTADGPRITDVNVSGVSLALSYRDQFAAAMQSNGGNVAALIPELRGKLAVTSTGAPTRK
jgi:phospholipid transport system substrate-binding protein